LQEAIIKTCQSAVDAYGLKSLAGSDGEVKVHEDVTAIAKGYKIGDTVKFTATLNASYDTSMTEIVSLNDSGDAVDVAAEAVDAVAEAVDVAAEALLSED
jgi:hypothetical protein